MASMAPEIWELTVDSARRTQSEFINPLDLFAQRTKNSYYNSYTRIMIRQKCD